MTVSSSNEKSGAHLQMIAQVHTLLQNMWNRAPPPPFMDASMQPPMPQTGDGYLNQMSGTSWMPNVKVPPPPTPPPQHPLQQQQQQHNQYNGNNHFSQPDQQQVGYFD